MGDKISRLYLDDTNGLIYDRRISDALNESVNIDNLSFKTIGNTTELQNRVAKSRMLGYHVIQLASNSFALIDRQSNVLILSNAPIYMAKNSNHVFRNMNVKNINFDNVDFSRVENLEYAFESVVGLEKVDLHGKDLRNLKTMTSMFEDSYIKHVDMHGLELNSLKEMQVAFSNTVIAVVNLSDTKIGPEVACNDLFNAAHIKNLITTGLKINISSSRNMFYDALIEGDEIDLRGMTLADEAYHDGTIFESFNTTNKHLKLRISNELFEKYGVDLLDSMNENILTCNLYIDDDKAHEYLRCPYCGKTVGHEDDTIECLDCGLSLTNDSHGKCLDYSARDKDYSLRVLMLKLMVINKRSGFKPIKLDTNLEKLFK